MCTVCCEGILLLRLEEKKEVYFSYRGVVKIRGLNIEYCIVNVSFDIAHVVYLD